MHHDHHHDHDHCHNHDHHHHDHDHCHHDHEHCDHNHEHCGQGGCGHCHHEHTPMEELVALMKYMANHNTAHANELAQLAMQLEKAGSHAAFEQVMAAVSDYEKGNMRLQAVLASLDVK